MILDFDQDWNQDDYIHSYYVLLILSRMSHHFK